MEKLGYIGKALAEVKVDLDQVIEALLNNCQGIH